MPITPVPTIFIQDAEQQHGATIAELWQCIDVSTTSAAFGDDADKKRQRAREFIEHGIDSPNAAVLIAVLEQAIIGTITGHLYKRPTSGGAMTGVIYSLWVNAEYRRRGIGQDLLDTIEQRLQDMGAQSFQVGWETQNTLAAEWWQKRGYCPYETIACKLTD